MIEFDIQPFVGAWPLEFGMTEKQVKKLMGRHETKVKRPPGAQYFWDEGRVNVSLDESGALVHIGFAPYSPYRISLSVNGTQIWTRRRKHQTDPNVQLLGLDPDPVEVQGRVLIFRELGISTAGYHNDVGDQSLCAFHRGAWDDSIPEAKAPNLRQYQ